MITCGISFVNRASGLLQLAFGVLVAARFGWTKAVLQHQIENQSYEKYLLNQFIPVGANGFSQRALRAERPLAPAGFTPAERWLSTVPNQGLRPG